MDDERPDSSGGEDQPRAYGQRRRAGGARPGGGLRRGGDDRRRQVRDDRPPPAPVVEPESARPARALLEEILVKMGVDGDVRYYARPEGEYLEVRGPDLANLIGRHGHTLEALNLIFNNIMNIGVRKDRHYFTIDAEGYRARRADVPARGRAREPRARDPREAPDPAGTDAAVGTQDRPPRARGQSVRDDRVVRRRSRPSRRRLAARRVRPNAR